MIIVLDIDGTLCNNTNGEYEKAKPFQNMIDVVNNMYDNGDRIIIHTARGGGLFDGKIGMINTKWYAFTQNQLDSWGVKYHELHLGKITGDVYVDDRGFRIRSDGTGSDALREFLRGNVNPDGE